MSEQQVPGAWRGLVVVCAALLLGMTPWFSTSAVMSQLSQAWALTTTSASFLAIAMQLGFVVGAVGSAYLNLADRCSPRRLMLLGSLAAAVANLALVAAGGALPAMGLWFLTGAFLALVYPPSVKVLSSWFCRGRGLALGFLAGALTLGSAAPHLINAFGGVDWRGVVVVTSALTVAGGLLAELVGRDGPYASPRSPFDPRQARLVFGNRGVRLASLAFLGHMWELYAMWTWFAVFFGDVLTAHGHDSPVRGAALATFVVIAVGAVGCWAGGLISDRHGPARAATLAMACSAVAATVIGFARGLPVGVVLVIGLVWGFSVIADSAQLWHW